MKVWLRKLDGVEMPQGVWLACQRVLLLTVFLLSVGCKPVGAQHPTAQREADVGDVGTLEVDEPSPERRLPEGWEDLEFRRWTSASGQTVEATFLGMRRDRVRLGAPDGGTTTIHISQLQRDDQIHARTLAAAQRSAGARGRAGETRVAAGFGDQCERILLRAIRGADREVLVAIYTLTRDLVEEELSRAAQRGVTVKVKYDEKQLDVSRMRELVNRLEENGVTTIPISMSGRFASMHHKFAVIDEYSVFTGSNNFTVMAATQNYENCVMIEDLAVARDFKQEFNRVHGD